MENILKCQICYDYMDIPVITPCSHNYCSLCIRKYLHYKTRCPLCFKDTFENELRPNRILENIIIQFAKVRDKLKSLIKETQNIEDSTIAQVAQTEQLNDSNGNNEKLTLQSASRLLQHDSISRNENITKTNRKKNKAQKELQASTEKSLPSPSAACSSKLLKISVSTMNEMNSNENSNTNNNNSNNIKKELCPVCQVGIPVINRDKHIEICYKRESAPVDIKTESKRQPLPKLVLNLMKDSELKKKMKELGLQTQGTRKILESRYYRYCILYNAECDKKKPRSIGELLKQCKDDEALEKKLAKVS